MGLIVYFVYFYWEKIRGWEHDRQKLEGEVVQIDMKKHRLQILFG